MTRYLLSDDAELHHADCLEAMKTLPDNSIDACVTDPPYGLEFMGKGWDKGVPPVAVWEQVIRVLKPGGHLVSFAGTRTYHRMVCAIEDAGFEIRDQLAWMYGTGFPKSHNIALAIDKEAKAIGHLAKSFNIKGGGDRADEFASNGRDFSIKHTPATPEAAEWQGWGTALKPAFEPIVLARKPLSEKTVAANVLRWGTGAINVDGCRVGTGDDKSSGGNTGQDKVAGGLHGGGVTRSVATDYSVGRWPANVVHDGSDEVVAAFPSQAGGGKATRGGSSDGKGIYGKSFPRGDGREVGFGDSGSAARFFYSAKASKADRAGSKHPTVKPVALMQWLCRLITPPGGIVLDPFAGTGTTGAAAIAEGFLAVLCEREAEYVEDIKARFAKLVSAA